MNLGQKSNLQIFGCRVIGLLLKVEFVRLVLFCSVIIDFMVEEGQRAVTMEMVRDGVVGITSVSVSRVSTHLGIPLASMVPSWRWHIRSIGIMKAPFIWINSNVSNVPTAVAIVWVLLHAWPRTTGSSALHS